MTTKSQAVANDVAALLRARNPLLWIVTREEARVENYLVEAGKAAKYQTYFWDVADGICDPQGILLEETQDPGQALTWIKSRALDLEFEDRRLFIMRDLPAWLSGPGGAATQRSLRNLARLFPDLPLERGQAIIVLSPSTDVPPELAGHTTVIDWPLPDREEIAATLDAKLLQVPEDLRAAAAPNGTREAAIDAAVGLSQLEAEACYGKSLVQLKKIDPVIVSREKRRVIARERILEWSDPLPGGLDSVGGLDVLKGWLNKRKLAFSRDARDWGLPSPKGVLLVGVPGCGKSLSAKAVATAYEAPLIRFDMGAQKSKFVGESEANQRKAFAVIEAIGKCVVWIDEIEKSLQGATSGSADGGVSADALGGLLNWMQERKGDAFLVATANNPDALPPELIRKGRFDEVFFVDLPNAQERIGVLVAALKANGREDAAIDLERVGAACEGFSGAEIATLVPEAMFTAYSENKRQINTEDLLAVAETVVPLTQSAPDKIKAYREWAKGKARLATSKASGAPVPVRGGQLDI